MRTTRYLAVEKAVQKMYLHELKKKQQETNNKVRKEDRESRFSAKSPSLK